MASNADPLEAAWTSGSYEEVARQYLGMAGRLVDAAPIQEATPVLDIGCGTGNVAIAAARSGGDVAGIDRTAAFLDRARQHAGLAGYPDIQWYEADAADLPFDADRFAVTLSNLGHMYADPTAATEELVRVTEPGGYVGFTAWTPSSLYPTMAQTFLPYLDPADLPDISEPPFMWGSTDVVSDRLAPAVTDLGFEHRAVDVPAMSPAHFRNETLQVSGIFAELYDRIDQSDRQALQSDLDDVIHGVYDPRHQVVKLEYLQTTGRIA